MIQTKNVEVDVNDEYQKIISKCKFVSKKDEWFVEGSEVKCVDKLSYSYYNTGDKFNEGWSLFEGYTNETYESYIGELPRLDEETCPFNEFMIYDEHGYDIAELTLDEYRILLNK